jgi:hypothetical protein
VHEPAHPGRGRGADHRPRAVAVDAVQRRRVGRAQRVDPGDVVGDVRVAHPGRERALVEQSPRTTSARAAELGGRALGPGERDDAVPAGDQPLHERAADQPGAAGDEDPLAHGRVSRGP